MNYIYIYVKVGSHHFRSRFTVATISYCQAFMAEIIIIIQKEVFSWWRADFQGCFEVLKHPETADA